MPAITVRVVMRLPQVLAHLRNDGSGGGRNHIFVIARRLKSRRGDLLKPGSLPGVDKDLGCMRLPQALTHLRNDDSGGI